MGTVKERLKSDEAHLEKARGTQQQCIEYCTKEETRVAGPFQLGQPSEGQGERKDLKYLCTMVKAGKKDRELAEADEVLYAKYHKHAHALRTALERPEVREVKVLVLWGPTGIGKTHAAFTRFQDMHRLMHSEGKIWFDGYQGEKVLIIDEFEGQIKITFLLQLLDKWPLRTEIKTTSCCAKWELVIITSNSDPDTWYGAMGGTCNAQQKDALKRRLTWVIHADSREELETKMDQWMAEVGPTQPL